MNISSTCQPFAAPSRCPPHPPPHPTPFPSSNVGFGLKVLWRLSNSQAVSLMQLVLMTFVL